MEERFEFGLWWVPGSAASGSTGSRWTEIARSIPSASVSHQSTILFGLAEAQSGLPDAAAPSRAEYDISKGKHQPAGGGAHDEPELVDDRALAGGPVEGAGPLSSFGGRPEEAARHLRGGRSVRLDEQGVVASRRGMVHRHVRR